MSPRSYNLLDTTRGDFVLNAQSIAAMLAIGNSFFVNETTGLDTNPGSSARPFKTLDAGLAAATANNGDVVYLMGTSHRTTTLNWNKNGVNLVGLLAPSNNSRARISVTGSSVFTPLVNVTAQGCSFVDIATFHGFNDASAQVCWAEAGGRNYYENVEFLGMGDATAAAQAGGRSLTIGGSGENQLINCTIGTDTVLRATNANASLEFLAHTARNIFRGCLFQAIVSDAADVHILAGSSSVDRSQYLFGCILANAVDSTGTAMTQAISWATDAGGNIILDQTCQSIGATAIATSGPVYGANALGATTSNIGLKLT